MRADGGRSSSPRRSRSRARSSSPRSRWTRRSTRSRPPRRATSRTSCCSSSTCSTPCCSLITLTTLVAVALLSVREHIRDYGVLKAIGLTPRQIVSTDELPRRARRVASLLAIPLGIGLYLALFPIAGDRRDRRHRALVVARADPGGNRRRGGRGDESSGLAGHPAPHRRTRSATSEPFVMTSGLPRAPLAGPP